MVIDQVKVLGWAMASMKVITVPTRTTNMTGFLIWMAGFSFLNGVDQRLPENLAVEEAAGLGDAVGCLGSRPRLARLDGGHGHQKNFPWLSCSTIGPRETAGKKVRPPMMMMTPMVRPMNMALSVRNVPSDAGTTFLAASAPPKGEGRDHDAEPADQHVDGADDVVEGGVAGEAGQGRAVVVALRGQGRRGSR